MDKHMLAVFLVLLFVPLLTLILITPYILVKYHRDRKLSFSGCAFRYLLLLSVLAAFYMTVLPLPTLEEVKAMTNPSVQLIPFNCLIQLFSHAGPANTDWGIVVPAAKTHVFLSAFFNIIMLIPVGFFLRAAYHKCSHKKVLLIGFCLSLAFELIQLSGLFFIYPRPYRIFDVDDLIGNTLGAWIGYLIEPFFERVYPTHLQKTYHSRLGGEVSFLHRLPADLLDCIIIFVPSLLGICMLFGDPAQPFIESGDPSAFPIFFLFSLGMSAVLAVITFLRKGRSPGMQVFGLELRSTRGSSLTLKQCLLRTMILSFYLILPTLDKWLFFKIDNYNGLPSICLALAGAICDIMIACFLFSLLIHIVTHGEPLPFERISGTKLGLYSNARNERKLQIFYSGQLNSESISACTGAIFEFLMSQEFEQKKCLRVQYLAEGVLLDWINQGLENTFFDLRYDCRFFRKTLVICAPGPQCMLALHADESYIELLSGTRLSFDAYFTGDMNVFSIDIP